MRNFLLLIKNFNKIKINLENLFILKRELN